MEKRTNHGSPGFHKYYIRIVPGSGEPCIEIHYLFLLIPFVMAISGYLDRYLMILASMLLHELGHMSAAAVLKRAVDRISALPVGFCIDLRNDVQESFVDRRRSREDAVILFSGPMANLIVFLICLPGVNVHALVEMGPMHFFIVLNACLALFNLLPLYPMDGGKILQIILTRCLGLFSGTRYTRMITIILSLIFIAGGICQFVGNSYNFSLLLIGTYILFLPDTTKKEAVFMNIKQLLYKRSRLLKKGIYGARDLVVVHGTPIHATLGYMDFDRFHIVHVLDDSLKVCGTFTEQEIMDALLGGNVDMTFDDLMKTLKT